MKEDRQIFRDNLRYFMKKKGVDRAELAKNLGLPYHTVVSWDTGQRYPRIDKIESLAIYFDIKKSDLIEWRFREIRRDEYWEIHDEFTRRPELKRLFYMLKHMKDKDIDRAIAVIELMDKGWG